MKFHPNFSVQDQKFLFFEKKLSLGVRSPCIVLFKQFMSNIATEILGVQIVNSKFKMIFIICTALCAAQGSKEKSGFDIRLVFLQVIA